MDEHLAEFRKKIDGLDVEIVRLLSERAELAAAVAERKISVLLETDTSPDRSQFLRYAREVEVLKRIVELNQGPFSDQAIANIYKTLIGETLALEVPLRVAVLGPQGTYSHDAARNHFGLAQEVCFYTSFEECVGAVSSQATDFALVAVENSLAGSVGAGLDAIADAPRNVFVVADALQRVSHHLVGDVAFWQEHTSRDRDTVTPVNVYGHPQALAQSSVWLQKWRGYLHPVEVLSSGVAAERCHSEKTSFAIAGRTAKDIYDLDAIQINIQNRSDNWTKFLVLGRHPDKATGDDRSFIVVNTQNQAGALNGVLQAFAEHDVNLARLHTRPHPRNRHEHQFFIEMDGHADDANVAAALQWISSQETYDVRISGSYPRAPFPLN